MEASRPLIDAIWLTKVRQARGMSEDARMLAGPRLFQGVCERMKEGLRDDHPEAREEEIHRLLLRNLSRLRRVQSRAIS